MSLLFLKRMSLSTVLVHGTVVTGIGYEKVSSKLPDQRDISTDAVVMP